MCFWNQKRKNEDGTKRTAGHLRCAAQGQGERPILAFLPPHHGDRYLERRGDIDKLRRILGHADLRTTSIYVHLKPSYVTEGHEQFSALSPMG